VEDKGSTAANLLSRAWYGDSIEAFLAARSDTVIGRLAANGDFALLQTQRDAWILQLEILRNALQGLTGALYLEFNIPRMGRRIDAVILVRSVIFVVEFKVGEAKFDRTAMEQVWDYALDLKNFHKASHTVAIVPVLVATQASHSAQASLFEDADRVYRPMLLNADDLGVQLRAIEPKISGEVIDAYHWAAAPYYPTPTIVEAARALYRQHSVEAIARFDAGRKNLRVTSRRVEELVDQARAQQEKVICFVTGVPGAGKTLIGLNVATHRRRTDEPTHAVFLSGNGPLVAVLREALTRDEYQRRAALGEKVRKGQIGESVKAFIQNVHHFRDDALATADAPVEHVVIFDEAQRAWNLKKTAYFMQRKKKRAGFSQSEPEFLISCMDRHKDWAVIVCLVGGGQEINTGEAGIGAWLDAVNKSFPEWQVYISDRLTDTEYAAGQALESVSARSHVFLDSDLHLAVSMRSFRAENVSLFVKALLDCDQHTAKRALEGLGNRYPLVVTRNLWRAKEWIKSRARGSERYGLMASSKAQRLKPHAIDIRVHIDPVQWFLNDKDDTRSSYYLEDAATEFQVQGLELDWTCVTWDGDFRFTGSGWSFHDFRGDRWTNVNDSDARNYLRNAYRVLLTRARQGMVIFIPNGEASDHTRRTEYYEPTFQYLCGLGIPILN